MILKNTKPYVKELIPIYLREYAEANDITFDHSTWGVIIGDDEVTEISFDVTTDATRDKKGRFFGHKSRAIDYILSKIRVHYPDMEVFDG